MSVVHCWHTLCHGTWGDVLAYLIRLLGDQDVFTSVVVFQPWKLQQTHTCFQVFQVGRDGWRPGGFNPHPPSLSLVCLTAVLVVGFIIANSEQTVYLSVYPAWQCHPESLSSSCHVPCDRRQTSWSFLNLVVSWNDWSFPFWLCQVLHHGNTKW